MSLFVFGLHIIIFFESLESYLPLYSSVKRDTTHSPSTKSVRHQCTQTDSGYTAKNARVENLGVVWPLPFVVNCKHGGSFAMGWRGGEDRQDEGHAEGERAAVGPSLLFRAPRPRNHRSVVYCSLRVRVFFRLLVLPPISRKYCLFRLFPQIYPVCSTSATPTSGPVQAAPREAVPFSHSPASTPFVAWPGRLRCNRSRRSSLHVPQPAVFRCHCINVCVYAPTSIYLLFIPVRGTLDIDNVVFDVFSSGNLSRSRENKTRHTSRGRGAQLPAARGTMAKVVRWWPAVAAPGCSPLLLFDAAHLRIGPRVLVGTVETICQPSQRATAVQVVLHY